MPTRFIHNVLKKANPVFAKPEQSVFDVAMSMVESGESAALIVKDNKTVGTVAEHDLIIRVLLVGADVKSIAVAQIMTHDTVTIRPDALFGRALYLYA